MSRTTITSAGLQAMNARESDEALLGLVEIDPPGGDVIRVTSDGVNTTHTGNTYVPFPFKIELPSDKEEEIGDGRLTISNVTAEIDNAIDGLEEPALVTIKIVRASEPDTIESQWPEFDLVNAKSDLENVEGTLTLENYAREPFPKDSMDPVNLPGIF